MESLFGDIMMILQKFRSVDDEVRVANGWTVHYLKDLIIFFSFSMQVVCFLLLNLYLHLAWSLHSIINSETVSLESLSSLLNKRNALLEHLDQYLNDPTEIGKSGNQLASRVRTSCPHIYQVQ